MRRVHVRSAHAGAGVGGGLGQAVRPGGACSVSVAAEEGLSAAVTAQARVADAPMAAVAEKHTRHVHDMHCMKVSCRGEGWTAQKCTDV